MAITTYTLPAATIWKYAGNVVGIPDLNGVYVAGNIGAPGITPLPATVIAAQLSQTADLVSYDATYGGSAKAIFLAVPTSTTVTPGLAYTWKGDGTIVVLSTTVAAAAQSGCPLAFAINTVASNATSIQYTWFMVYGRAVALKGATITAQPNSPLFVSNVTAGRVRTTASVLRTIIGIRSANIATATGSVIPVWLNWPNVGPGV